MRYLILSGVLGLVTAVGLSAANVHRVPLRVPAEFNKTMENHGEDVYQVLGPQTPLPPYRDAVLIDSSKNGYGMLVSETNPISWIPGTDIILLAYRQWAGENGSSGVIGSAYSEDMGASWIISTSLNSGTASNYMGRYPSALATPDFPVVLWNEYGGGGGQYGGRAYYTYDEGGYGIGLWHTPEDVHNNPNANDTWLGSPVFNIDADGNYIFSVVYADWSNDRDRLYFRATTDGAWAGDPLSWENAYIILQNAREFLWDGSSNYTANGNLDINDNGVGYYVTSAYWNDTLQIANHTLFIKKTTDYGATWSNWFYIPDAVLNARFADVFPDSLYDSTSGEWSTLPEDWTPFIAYDLEVLVDDDGGLHVLGGVLPSGGGYVYPAWSENNGIYHFYVAADDFVGAAGPVSNVDISFVASMQLGWMYDDPGWQGNVMGLAKDDAAAGILYATYYTISAADTANNVAFMDIFVTRSLDNGLTWEEPINITNTLDGDIDETDPHINKVAHEGTVFILYQVPDYNVATVNPPSQSEDYKNRIYYTTYSFPPVVAVDEDQQSVPQAFALHQNFPNPFNPTTQIKVDVPVDGEVTLSVFDLRGRTVALLHRGYLSAGQHTFTFSGANLSSGTYFYRLTAPGFQAVRKMLLLK